MTVSVRCLHRDDPLSAGLLPGAVSRMQAFCRRFDSDTDPGELAEMVWRCFATRDPRLGLWIATDDAWRIVGHMLATPEPLERTAGWTHVLLRQVEWDRGVDGRQIGQRVKQELIDWTRRLGVTRVRALTHRSSAALERAWGFKPFKTLIQMDLSRQESFASLPVHANDTPGEG